MPINSKTIFIIGFILFLLPVIRALFCAIRNIKQDDGQNLSILVLFIVSGFFGIWYYNLLFMIVLYINILMVKRKDV